MAPLILITPLVILIEISLYVLPEYVTISSILLAVVYLSTLTYSILIASIGISTGYKIAMYRAIITVISSLLAASITAIVLLIAFW